ncbi:MAG: DNA cytosine methyltransferase, partial [Rhodospirillales bacterium]|nr:DNA cytosine methyltransferase [Rhodospirillales bacterium]
MAAYYNEIDPYAAQWLRNLIAAGHIAPGDVDERSIADVRADDLVEYRQCHFFAGIGGWSYALRLAGWGDDRPVWTGSCPCQPFSVAGSGAGTADQRHLWPHWFWLISQCRPEVVFGEQVEAAIRHGWLDLVYGDLEGIGYAVAAAGIPAASVGAPHIRQRLWFVADRLGTGLEGRDKGEVGRQREAAERSGGAGGVGDGDGAGSLPSALSGVHRGEESAGPRHGESERLGPIGGLADA